MNSPQEYRSSCVSLIIVALLFVLELVLLLYGLHQDNLVLAVVSIAFASLLFLLFFSLTVTVSRSGLVLSFGIGLLRRSIALEEIQRMELVPNASLLSLYDPRREHILRVHLRSGGYANIAVGDGKRMMEIISTFTRQR